MSKSWRDADGLPQGAAACRDAPSIPERLLDRRHAESGKQFARIARANERDGKSHCTGKNPLRQSRMAKERPIPGGVVHALPQDLAAALKRHQTALATWDDITPLARNEWICWVESAKKQETRRKRIDWGCESLGEGKRRPCCWEGCSHREKTGR
jgi:uncharacterized protein YdeI (YjbR/CyaY-like superfamily)